MAQEQGDRTWTQLDLSRLFHAVMRQCFGEVVQVAAEHKHDLLGEKVVLDPETGRPNFVFTFREAARKKDLTAVPKTIGDLPVRINFQP